MRELDSSCGGLLPLIASLEALPAVRDDRSEAWRTRGDLRAASLELGRSLASERKRLVFLFCSNATGTVIALLAAAAAGHAIALIDPGLAEDKLQALLEAYEPELVLGTGDVGGILHDLADQSKDWRRDERIADDVAWLTRSSTAPAPDINPAVQLLLSTSGTTGSQKYVMLSGDAIVANAKQIAQALAIDENSTGIAHLPLHYSYGLSVLTSHLIRGGRIYFVSDSIMTPSFWSKIEDAGGSHFPGVPFHYATLARLGASLIPDSVKVFTQAGGALDPRIQAKMHDLAARQGGQFFAMYGQTEASPRMTTLQHADFTRKIGSVGVALPGGRLSIIDEAGEELPAGSVGAVVYEGPNVMLGYASGRDDLAKGDELKGRLETGDLGRLDSERFLYLTGRTKRFAKIAGYRLGLDEIEKELSAICPVACLDLGEKIAVVHEQATETALKSRVRELAADYKVPVSSFSLSRTMQIPRGASGKIDYARLKESLHV
jgi:acyl-CoA synthetase (AMP-forming)/AMP-acid ligase II